MTLTTCATPLVATAGGGRAHLPQCPHVVGRAAGPVAPHRLLPVCEWSEKELTGFGRTRFDDLDAALAAFRAPVHNRALIKAALARVEHDEIWMPYSASYVALGLRGRGVAWTGKTYVVPAPGTSLELPGFVGGTRGPGRQSEGVWGATCPRCSLARARNGACGCDD